MTDPGVTQHAQILMDWSTRVKRGDMVLIRSSPEAYDIALAVTKEVGRRGGSSMVTMEDDEIVVAYLNSAMRKPRCSLLSTLRLQWRNQT